MLDRDEDSPLETIETATEMWRFLKYGELPKRRDCRPVEDRDDHLSYHERVQCDRIDLGRNDAGEWIGFM